MAEIAKLRILTFLFLVAILTILLAGNLASLQLKPGIPLPDPTGNSGAEPQTYFMDNGGLSVKTFSKAILGFFLIGCLLFILFLLIKSAYWNRRTVVKAFVYIASASLVVGGILYLLLKPHGSYDSPDMYLPPAASTVAGPPLGSMPSILLWISGVGLAVVIILFLIWIIYWGKNSRAASDPVQFAAEEAVQAISDGQDFKSAILRCYRQMSLVLKEEQGIEFELAMTAREFENLLKKRGLPREPVHEITELFEFVRYGNESPSPEEENRAVNSLNNVIQFCRETKRRK